MADKDLNEKKYDAINPDSIITVKLNGRFYGDVRAMFMSLLLKGRNKEQIAQTFTNLRNKKVADENEYHLHILFHLIANMETQAKEQGYIIKESVPGDLTEDLQDSDSNDGPSE